ncbi:heavy-metal-associated domain-containing protein [Actinophytocola oryzae]|uniref:Copper chaperone CopZ n=1 Tax=Actinophytocola oryzae TaxID=502181 RepID=A0A4R7V883_9PSEU|nr:heavy metal-associated domain-containing protein [Actinophytocola oryzae]TDV44266.1 copper chaperone CopZ [Actinophytocola oryzae]
MTESIYIVNGMSCGHCAASVTEEVGGLDGVRGVQVDVDTGRVVVTSEAPLPVEQVVHAVREAGFEVAG